MTSIRDQLIRLIALNHAEQWVPHHVALEQLEHFGDRLIPGLIDCLTDTDAEIRQLAVELLGHAQADSAVEAIIERLNDEDRLVQVAAIYALAEFGPLAVAAVPKLEPWLFDSDEYLRLLAATAIIRIDPSRTDQLMPMVFAGAKSGDAPLRDMAHEFIDQQDHSLSALLRRVVERHWQHHSMSLQIHWSATDADGVLTCEAAPVYQEVVGGSGDGSKVWAGYEVDLTAFAAEPAIEIERITAESLCVMCNETPGVIVHGRIHGQPYVLRLHQEPLPNSEPKERLDTQSNQVIPISEKKP